MVRLAPAEEARAAFCLPDRAHDMGATFPCARWMVLDSGAT
jgi:hypothetical protein